MVNDDLAAKTLREKCVKGDALRMGSHLDELQEIWDTLNTCFERTATPMMMRSGGSTQSESERKERTWSSSKTWS